ncbi:hypothetical protein, partial [Roseibium sp.]|uniref:hypothetical protein n=1 Tax=Roseibium sp. TaxID=1936156 RepID=UPI003D0B1BA9
TTKGGGSGHMDSGLGQETRVQHDFLLLEAGSVPSRCNPGQFIATSDKRIFDKSRLEKREHQQFIDKL